MKPVSVRFQCFGPYMAEQYIDFEELQKNGLFLICGETGAGKTTILDAMCYALYGKSSGGLRGDLSVMRCKLAEKDDVTHVEFIFDCNGRRYKFTRSLKYGRKKLNDSHNCLVLEGEEFVPIFENPKATVVNAKAQELIGLTYDQFRQVIILPQGQFERLLVSDSAEKEKILVSLFHADRWQRIAEELYRRVAEQDNELKQEKLQISAKLKEYGCEKLEQLIEKKSAQAEAAAGLKIQLTTAEEALTTCRKRSDEAILDNRAFEELARTETALRTLEGEAAHYDAEEILLKNADAAETIRPAHLAFRDAKANKLRAEGLVTQAEAALIQAQTALSKAESGQAEHEANRPAYEAGKQKKALLETSRELYRSLKEKEQAAKSAKKALSAAKKEQETAETQYSLRDKAWQRALRAQKQSIEDYQTALTAYLRDIGSTLAQELEPGQPCPVCGSREHPSPAQPTEDHVTKEAVDKKKAAMNAANTAEADAMGQRDTAEKARTKAAETCNHAAQAEAVARTEYENALSRRIEGIETEKQLEQEITALKESANTFEQADTQLRKALEAAKADAITAQGRLDAARESLTAAQTHYTAQSADWEQALADSGLATEEAFRNADLTPEEKQQRRTALIGYRKDLAQTRQQLAERQAALEGRTAPDMEALRRAMLDAETAHKQLSRQQILAVNTLETMESDAKNLEKRLHKYEQRRTTVDADLDFANRLRGRSGVSLQRYVLGVMLTSITTEANRLLANVYGGRYQLYRTNEIAGSGHKGGLELEVYDSQTNARRSVTTLSGGEKFLVALSLAIGLSTVVQAQGDGIRLEAMFVDEGFGSLDAEAVNDALEVLQGIQRSSGIVGIISHVETLAEIIPTRIEIRKGKNGSQCHIRS
ncbi:MAG: SMC family ATPase [Oscillospiraceae bacterium]|nr:SMC family ATPase [Oscillospiraceae bacterium]